MTKKQRIACIVAGLLLGALGVLGVFLPLPQQPVVEGGTQAVINRVAEMIVSPGPFTNTGRSTLQGAVTAGAGLTVTAGGVDFPANAVALGDLNFPGAGISTVCPNGCQYATPRAAVLGVVGTVNNPQVVLVAPGVYTDQYGAGIGDYEYVVGWGREATTWILNGSMFGLVAVGNGGIQNLTLSYANNPGTAGGVLEDSSISTGGTFRIFNAEIRCPDASVSGLYLWNVSTLTFDIRESRINCPLSQAILSKTNSPITVRESELVGGAQAVWFYGSISPSVTIVGTTLLATTNSISATNALTIAVCLSPMQKALGTTVTNSCVNPANPTLP